LKRDCSRRSEVEIQIVAPIIRAAINRLDLDGRDGIGVVVPHRAQRAALQRRFPELAAAGAIDTVERFQGGERDLIVVSATASDPEFVLAEASFLLNPNRLNVAFSRPRKKLIVVGSTTIFRLMPPDMQTFEDALLWKRLRYEFSADVLWEGSIAGAEVRISGRRAG
jgi:superfamily I DNA and/or RNA helicase